ncbi:Uncharacterized protein Adt_27850 [Abeliophyllum distichum]|uniref:Uncharacterized protein n=1 Tax=Abeliophyllum distichum TaxID=126358 RepID=A0ABD1RUW9_9LAMI
MQEADSSTVQFNSVQPDLEAQTFARTDVEPITIEDDVVQQVQRANRAAHNDFIQELQECDDFGLYTMNSTAMVSEGCSTIPSENPPSEPPRKRRGQGPTRGKRSEKVVSTCGHKLKVEFNDQNRRVIGPNASSFANEMGIVVRSMALLAVKRWKDIDHAQKMPMIDRLKEKYEFETTKMIEQSLDKSMNKQWNEYRCMHKDFKNVGSIEDIGGAKRSKPNSVAEQGDWDFLCDHFGSDALKKKMLELHISTQNFPRKENQDSLHLIENQICNQVLGKKFGYSEPHKSLSRKMRLDDDDASLENAALRTRVKDLQDQLKNWTDVLSRIPRDILLPVQNDTSQASGSNEDL